MPREFPAALSPYRFSAGIAALAVFLSILPHAMPADRQITSAPHGHVLTNVGVWSPDSRWIAYDVRSSDGIFDGTRIERVEVDTGRVEVLYESLNGAACGVVTWHPTEPRVVFIHGPERPSADWNYGASRRRGVVADARNPGVARPLDAMNYAPPFAPGALRGGSHVHVFSPDGAVVSFTYEDEVLARLGVVGEHDLNQRTIGVTLLGPGRGVAVARNHPRNHDGDGFSVVVARTENRPRPGSDDISRAFEEGWVLRPGGRRALAFLGNVTAPDGREHPEVFLAELPADLAAVGEGGALQGTATRRPAPPRGTIQRRLTFTSDRKFRGAATSPRHWLRAASDGGAIAFLMKDEAGEPQLWTVSPEGGEPRQVTRNATGVSSAFTWSPDGSRIAHVMDGSVCVTEIATGRTTRLTTRAEGHAAPLALACVFSPDGRRIAYQRNVASAAGVFAQIFVVDVHS